MLLCLHSVVKFTAISLKECISFFFNFIYYLFIFGCTGSIVAVCGLSLFAKSGPTLCLRRTGFSLQRLLLLQSTGSRVCSVQ